MSDDDIDDKVTNLQTLMTEMSIKVDSKKPDISSSSCSSDMIKIKPKIIKKLTESDSDDDNVDSMNFTNFEQEMKNAEKEVHIKVEPTSKKSETVHNKDNDDSDKSSSGEGWLGFDDKEQDIDNILNGMKMGSSPGRSENDDGVNIDYDDLSLKIDGLDDKMDTVITSLEDVVRSNEKLKRMLKQLLGLFGAMSTNNDINKIIPSGKVSIVDKSDVDDPVNKEGYFDKT